MGHKLLTLEYELHFNNFYVTDVYRHRWKSNQSVKFVIYNETVQQVNTYTNEVCKTAIITHLHARYIVYSSSRKFLRTNSPT